MTETHRRVSLLFPHVQRPLVTMSQNPISVWTKCSTIKTQRVSANLSHANLKKKNQNNVNKDKLCAM